jgi:hypothetical protein
MIDAQVNNIVFAWKSVLTSTIEVLLPKRWALLLWRSF